jgi:hypothetical protein
VIRKMLWLSIPAVVGAVVASNWQDAFRYIKIKQMNLGRGHPEVVPVEGRKGYARSEAEGAQDGTGDFDSARRGGPKYAEPGPVKPGELRRA